MGSRTWFRIFADKWMDGSIREETPETRAIFIDLLALAASGRWGDGGVIKLTEKEGVGDQNLAKILGVSTQKWVSIKGGLVSSNRISVNGNNIITICSWGKYQSEYERQKHYRNPKLQHEVTGRVTTEKEIEKEIENTKGVPPHSLEGWLERVKTASNPVSELGEMILLLSDGKEKPDYGRLGAIAKKHSPAYIAKLIWICVSARPADWLEYIQGMLRKKVTEEPDLGTRLKEY